MTTQNDDPFESDQPARMWHLGVLLDALKDLVRGSDAAAKIAALEQKVAALQQRTAAPGVKWAGVHERGRQYDEGELVTHDGSLWLSLRTVNLSRPGKDPNAWRLVVKGDRR